MNHGNDFSPNVHLGAPAIIDPMGRWIATSALAE